jgi:hypothetical protein
MLNAFACKMQEIKSKLLWRLDDTRGERFAGGPAIRAETTF